MWLALAYISIHSPSTGALQKESVNESVDKSASLINKSTGKDQEDYWIITGLQQ